MKNALLHLLLFLLSGLYTALSAQIRPEDKCILNYTQVLFECPPVPNATQYTFEISDAAAAEDKKEYTGASPVKIVNALSFGKSYKWKYTANSKSGKKLLTSDYFSFTIKAVDLVNKNLYRMRITHMDSAINKNDLVLIDYNRIAINRTGEPLWYLPDIKNKVNYLQRIRDLKMTKDGTFTFINNRSAIECDISGNIVWEAPPLADSNAFYHHCFTKLQSGNYMVIGTTFVYKEIPATYPADKIKKLSNVKTTNGITSVKVEYGTILEYNFKGELVWSWDSEKYIDDRDIFSHTTADTLPTLGAHLNSFDINEEKNLVSAGFRDLSRIIVIDKKTGVILKSYGKKLISGEAQQANGWFAFQHDSRFLKDGRIAVFNNNAILTNPNATSSVLILDNPESTTNSTQPVWELNCSFDQQANGRSLKGGCVNELSNNNLLVCMGNLNRIFEVSPEKKILWDGFCEIYSASQKNWQAYSQYRVSPALSLYPNYFSAELLSNSYKKKTHQIEVKITNEGSAADTYTINFKNEAGTLLTAFPEIKLESGASLASLYTIGVETHQGAKQIIIEVKSKTNSANKKTLTCEF